MTLRRSVGLAAVAATVASLAYMAYLAAPKHGLPIVETKVDGFWQVNSGWSPLVDPKADAAPTGWRVRAGADPAKPALVIYLRRKAVGSWGDDERNATLECDGRRLPLSCRRAEPVEGETVRSSFLICTGSRDKLAALAEASDVAITLGGRRCSFGASGRATFKTLLDRSRQE